MNLFSSGQISTKNLQGLSRLIRQVDDDILGSKEFQEKSLKLVNKYAQRLLYHYYSLAIPAQKTPTKLFILSHMRSGSSLLTHILNTNPEIAGYGETHIEYSSQKEFYALIAKVHVYLRKFIVSEKYILDKILHNDRLANTKLLTKEPRIYGIFLVREPQRSLASLMKLWSDWDENTALNYYTSRLHNLVSYAKLINDKSRSILLTYDQLVQESDQVLLALQKFLDVGQPFSSEYEVLPTTGLKYIGDSSANIKAGKIIKTSHDSKVKITPALLEQGWQAFHDCHAALSKSCSVIS